MDKRLLTPTFLSQNMDYVQKELAKEGLTMVKKTLDITEEESDVIGYDIVPLVKGK